VRVIFGVQNPYPLSGALSLTGATSSTGNSSLSLVQTIPLPNVTSRIDHMGVDKKGERLFVAELGNNSVDIIDLRGGVNALVALLLGSTHLKESLLFQSLTDCLLQIELMVQSTFLMAKPSLFCKQ
jgi:hypothetical protein